MSFATYGSIDTVAHKHGIRWEQDEFTGSVEKGPSESLRSWLAFARDHVAPRVSENAVCENLIYPVLRDVWMSYLDDLTVWSHIPLVYDEDLCGTPDYIIARRSPLGHFVRDIPYLLVVEAKKDDFEVGWGQCVAAMLAAQKLNNIPEVTLYGVTTNGIGWEIGKLKGSVFTNDPRPFSLGDLEQLCSVLHYLFEQCRAQVRRLPRSA